MELAIEVLAATAVTPEPRIPTPAHTRTVVQNPRCTKRQRAAAPAVNMTTNIPVPTPPCLPFALWRAVLPFVLDSKSASFQEAHAIVSKLVVLCKAMGHPDVVRFLHVRLCASDLHFVPAALIAAEPDGELRAVLPAWVAHSEHVEFDATGASSAQLKATLRALPHLHTFRVVQGVPSPYNRQANTGPVLTDDSIAFLAEHCHKLQHLELHQCRALTNAAFEALAKGCPALQHLDIKYCNQGTITDAAFVALGRCTKLQFLDMSGCNQRGITDVAFASLAAGCPALQHLGMQNCNQSTITNAAFVAIGRCAALLSLNMSCCNQTTITDAAFVAIGTLSQLQTLTMSDCFQRTITDAALWAIHGCTKLRSLNISGCILTRTPSRTLRLWRLQGLPDAPILGHELCTQGTITDAAFVALATGCTMLQHHTQHGGGLPHRE